LHPDPLLDGELHKPSKKHNNAVGGAGAAGALAAKNAGQHEHLELHQSQHIKRERQKFDAQGVGVGVADDGDFEEGEGEVDGNMDAAEYLLVSSLLIDSTDSLDLVSRLLIDSIDSLDLVSRLQALKSIQIYTNTECSCLVAFCTWIPTTSLWSGQWRVFGFLPQYPKAGIASSQQRGHSGWTLASGLRQQRRQTTATTTTTASWWRTFK
jgi:hypothetical protein